MNLSTVQTRLVFDSDEIDGTKDFIHIQHRCELI